MLQYSVVIIKNVQTCDTVQGVCCKIFFFFFIIYLFIFIQKYMFLCPVFYININTYKNMTTKLIVSKNKTLFIMYLKIMRCYCFRTFNKKLLKNWKKGSDTLSGKWNKFILFSWTFDRKSPYIKYEKTYDIVLIKVGLTKYSYLFK